ncbi:MULTISPECIES: YkgJ family cysteine cluster protein [unclassified Uliginosibacterium]|uniref:YkgJ family cysteine cluster protein n=1 Tax=unclassified Uliginosibacterium TaxID=2621521 RepID=UPI000C7D27E4|nr:MULTISPECIES: YkgJ family cysteine cluster protein [unclassified Uliginosibacterium]MDO6385910.1 YkgJ family cysteine cluster protein [Uliginosibacterium sp. 31-12]PLK49923.1 Fe-S-oxidoreductase [Uliginosibacterium sp. TH139]
MQKHIVIHNAERDNIDTWVKYRNGLCDSCNAVCCTMPAEVRVRDLIRLGVIEAFDLETDPKHLAKRLQKMGVIEHFNFRHSLFTLARRAGGDCHFLDARTRQCTVYEKRPDTCRDHPQKIGPRPGFCPYRQKSRPAARSAD